MDEIRDGSLLRLSLKVERDNHNATIPAATMVMTDYVALAVVLASGSVPVTVTLNGETW